MAEAEMPTE